MTDERRLRMLRRLAWLAGGLVIACSAAAVLGAALRPRQFSTHRDAIGYELARRGIGYQQLYLDRSWPDTLTDEFYAAKIVIVLPTGQSISGRIECRVRRSQCAYSVGALGIASEPLPELVAAGERPAWLRWVERAAARLGLPVGGS